MTNQLASRPWILDTESAVAVSTNPLKIEHFEWIGYTDGTHKCELKDNLGNSIWAEDGDSDLRTLRSGKIGWIQGLALTTLDSGKVYVYYE